MNLTLPDVIIYDTYANLPASDPDGEGRLFIVSGAGTNAGKTYRDNGSTWDDVTQPIAKPYDINCALVGKPDDNALVLIFTAVRAVDFAANFSGSYGSVGANPASTAVYTVKNGSTTIGTISISTGGVFTFATDGGTAKSLAAGERLTITAPTPQDTTLSDVGFTLAGTR